MLSGNEVADLRDFMYEKLRYEFGKQVDLEWCLKFSMDTLREIERIKADSLKAGFDARNKKMEQIVEEREKNGT